MAKVAGTFTFSVPANQAVRSGWHLFWMGVWASLRRQPWKSIDVEMRYGDEK